MRHSAFLLPVSLALMVATGCGSTSSVAPTVTVTSSVVSTLETVTTSTATVTVTSTVTAAAEPVVEETTDSGESDVEACSLLTRKEAKVLADTPLGPALTGGRGDTCTYNGPVDGPLAQVMVAIGPGAKKYYDIDRLLKHEFEEIPGVGDEAYVENKTAFVRKGEVWALVELVRLVDEAEPRSRLKDAIVLIAERF